MNNLKNTANPSKPWQLNNKAELFGIYSKSKLKLNIFYDKNFEIKIIKNIYWISEMCIYYPFNFD